MVICVCVVCVQGGAGCFCACMAFIAFSLQSIPRCQDSAKTYTVEETLKTKEGFTITTSYSVDGGTINTGKTATLNGVSDNADKPTTVDYSNAYEKIVKPGYINITKTIKGEVTQEDINGLAFVVKCGDTVVGTYKLGLDFKKNSDGIYELKKPIKVEDCEKTYTIEETLETVEGFIVFTLRNDGSAECPGEVVVAGSPIVMVDLADPTYKVPNKPNLPSTGEEVSPATVIGIITILAAVFLAGTGVYRIKKKKN